MTSRWSGLGWLAIAGVVIIGAAFIVMAWRERGEEERLIRADADEIPNNAALSAFAMRLAEPAYTQNCASCHGANLSGDPNKGAPNLAKGHFLYGFGAVSEIERTIAYGVRSGRPKSWNLAAMPAFGTANPYARYKIEPLKPDEIDDVVTFILASSGQTAEAAAVARGQAVYVGKGLCFDCHSDDAKGDSSIGAPSLVAGSWLYGDGSRAALRNSIAYGHSGVCPGWRDAFDAAKVRALAVYVYLMSHRDHDHKLAEARP